MYSFGEFLYDYRMERNLTKIYRSLFFQPEGQLETLEKQLKLQIQDNRTNEYINSDIRKKNDRDLKQMIHIIKEVKN